jgi:hypothetical protein
MEAAWFVLDSSLLSQSGVSPAHSTVILRTTSKKEGKNWVSWGLVCTTVLDHSKSHSGITVVFQINVFAVE